MSYSPTQPDAVRPQPAIPAARFGWGFVLVLCIAFAAAVLPHLHRLEFFDGVEHFTLATVQEMKRDDSAARGLASGATPDSAAAAEMHRSDTADRGFASATTLNLAKPQTGDKTFDLAEPQTGGETLDLAKPQAGEETLDSTKPQAGNWLLPTLEGEPRVVKPPMTAWITAALVSPEMVRDLSTRDAGVRAAAFDRFVFHCRLPTLVCACLMLLGVYQLGRAVADPRLGMIAAIVCASFLLFLFQSRRATTDLQLAVWVTWTNALLVTAICQTRPRLGFIGAGVALGLASMAKGPHIALLMTVVPVAAFLLWEKTVILRYSEGSSRHDESAKSFGVPQDDKSEQRWLAPILLGALLALIIGLWWYAYVYFKVPGVMQIWRREIFRHDVNIGRNILKPDPWYAYDAIFTLLLPWTAWVILGTWDAITNSMARPMKHRGNVSADFNAATPVAAKGAALTPSPGIPGEGGDEGSVSMRESAASLKQNPHPTLSRRTGRGTSLRLPLLMLLLPIVVMSFFGEKKTRYLLPFVGSAAVLAAGAMARWIDDEQTCRDARQSVATGPDEGVPVTRASSPCEVRESTENLASENVNRPHGPEARVTTAHLAGQIATLIPVAREQIAHRIAATITIGAAAWFAVGLPIAGAIGSSKNFRDWTGHPLFSARFASVAGGVGLLLLIAGVIGSRRSMLLWIASILLTTWLGAEVRLRADFRSPGDSDDRPQRQLADQIWQTYPDAKIFSTDPPTLYGQLNRPAIVVSIYTNRIVYPRPPALPMVRTAQPMILITDSIQSIPPVPPGWKRWTTLPLRTGVRYVDVLE